MFSQIIFIIVQRFNKSNFTKLENLYLSSREFSPLSHPNDFSKRFVFLVMEFIATLIRVTLPNYLQSLPIPSSVMGIAKLTGTKPQILSILNLVSLHHEWLITNWTDDHSLSDILSVYIIIRCIQIRSRHKLVCDM